MRSSCALNHKAFILLLLFCWLPSITSLQAADPLLRREWQVDDVTREALLHIPKTDKKKPIPAPVVFAFHGHGGSMRNASRMFHVETLWPEAIVVYPQGLNTPGKLTDPEGKKPGWQRTPGDQGDRDLKFFDAVMASLKKDYDVDEKRIYATGHSNGGAFTYLLWQTRSEQFAAFAPSASLLPGARTLFGASSIESKRNNKSPGISPGSGSTKEGSRNAPGRELPSTAAKNIPILHVAGENDELVKYSWQKLFLDALRTHNGCIDGKPWKDDKRCTLYPSKTGGDVITYIHSGGHKYPGEAPELIVKFFKKQVK